jgi:hypothetical protein
VTLGLPLRSKAPPSLTLLASSSLFFTVACLARSSYSMAHLIKVITGFRVDRGLGHSAGLISTTEIVFWVAHLCAPLGLKRLSC